MSIISGFILIQIRSCLKTEVYQKFGVPHENSRWLPRWPLIVENECICEKIMYQYNHTEFQRCKIGSSNNMTSS